MKRLFTFLLSGAMALVAQTASANMAPDTLSNLSSRDTLTLYTFNGNNSGYLSGNNSYGDLEKAEQFRGPLGSTVTGALIGFGYANVLAADSSTTVTINVYSGTAASGPSTTVLATATVTLAQIAGSIGSELYVPFVGAPALTDQTFFVSVVLPTTGDTIAILTNQQDATDGQGWERWSDNSWNYFPPTYGTFPYQFGLDIQAITQGGGPVAAFQSSLLNNCGGTANVQFYSTSSNYTDSVQWYFPGGTPSSSTSQSPTVSYTTVGSNPVYLIAVSQFSGSDTLVSSVNVFTAVTVSASSTPATGSTATGTAIVTPLTGTLPFTIQWNDPNQDATDTATGLAPGTYYVQITDSNGCYVIDSAVVGSVSGIASLNGVNAIQVYPSPALNDLNINWGIATTAAYSITDISGRELRAYTATGSQTSTIDISWLAPGTYQISIRAARGSAMQTIRFVKL